MIGNPRREYLCLGFEPPERAGVNNPAPISLKQIPIRMFRLGVSPPAATGERKSKKREQSVLYLISLITPTAIWLATLDDLMSGSSSLRASAGLVFAKWRASEIVAWSFDTSKVG